MTNADKLRDITFECVRYFETYNADYSQDARDLAITILEIIREKEGAEK